MTQSVRRTAVVRLLVWAILLSLFVVTGPIPAFAQGVPDSEPAEEAELSPAERKARVAELKKAGDEAMLALRYEEALASYEEAYSLEPKPALLYNRGRALQALGRFPEALDQLERFDRDAPPALKARVPKLQKLIDEVRGKVSTLVLTCNHDGARVLIRDRLVGTTPLEEMRVTAGDADIQVTAEGFVPVKRRIVLRGNQKHEVSIELLSKKNTGLLIVRSPVAGATVSVDGKHVGTVPVEVTLKAGTHEVEVNHREYQEVATQAVVVAGERREVTVDLDSGKPFHQTWWFWTGVSAVVIAGAIVAIVVIGNTEKDATSGDIEPGQVSAPLEGGIPIFRF